MNGDIVGHHPEVKLGEVEQEFLREMCDAYSLTPTSMMGHLVRKAYVEMLDLMDTKKFKDEYFACPPAPVSSPPPKEPVDRSRKKKSMLGIE